MKGFATWFTIILMIFLVTGCSAALSTTKELADANSVRTFAPSDEPSVTVKPTGEAGKRGILKTLTSSGAGKCAYVFTNDTSAEPVEYALAILDKNETFSYNELDVIYRSTYLFEVEWGDDATLMVSLNEKDENEPGTMEAEGISVMFGRVSSVAQ